MGNLVIKGNKKISTHDKAILDLKIQRDKLVKYQKQIQIVLEREREIARTHLQNGDKKRALLVLKKKKYQETLLEQTDQQLMTVEELVNSIEYALVERKVLEGLRQGNAVLTKLNNEMKIEDVEKLMQDTEDAIAYQKEVGDILKGSLSDAVDAEVEEELEKMLQDSVKVTLPTVPVGDLPVGVETDATSTQEGTPAKQKQKEKEKEKKQLVEA